MKRALQVSFLLNLALIGFVILRLHWQEISQRVTPGSSAPQPIQQLTVRSNSMTSMDIAPFRWDQLWTQKEYAIYVANLRAIGCPETTVRDIVIGDVARVFARKRTEQQSDAAGTGPWSTGAESKLISKLLGDVTSAQTYAADRPKRRIRQVAPQPPSMPLVLQSVDLDSIGLQPDQKAVVDRLRQQFIDEVGGPNQDPNDPAYIQRWQAAQPEIDNMLEGMIGINAYGKYELQARLNQ